MKRAIEELAERLRASFPRAHVVITRPIRHDGIWSLDVDHAGQSLAIEWSKSLGFGISVVSAATYGENTDEGRLDLEQAAKRVFQLLGNLEEKTTPPIPVLLGRLRERRGLTQAELALKLGIKQASVSGLESRKDIQFSTISRVVRALGGQVELVVRFESETYRLASMDQLAGCAPVSTPIDPPSSHEDPPDPSFPELNATGSLSYAYEIAKSISEEHSFLNIP